MRITAIRYCLHPKATPLIISALCILSNIGCTAHKILNPSRQDYLKIFEQPESSGPCSIAVIEFDDQGELWEPRQLNAAIHHIQRQNEQSESGAIVVVYVHGWKQNAFWESGRLPKLKDDLLAIAATSQKTSGHSIPVVGVYIAWRGSSTTFKSAENITFWNRKSAAMRVSSLSMTETLMKVMHTAKQNPQSKCIVIGYSMGGLILEKSFSHALLLAALQEETLVDSPVDLMVTIGSASSALQAKQTIDAFKRNGSRLVIEDREGRLRDADVPLMLSITSETDTATGTAYPIGQWISTFFDRFRTYQDENLPSQKYLATRTIGHVPLLRSHTAEINDGNVQINQVENRYNTTPLWVMQVPDEILSGHSDESNPLFDNLLTQLIIGNNIYGSNEKLKLMHESEIADP
jgi:pimeloyl-ACP methyl ester carboxylesterase